MTERVIFPRKRSRKWGWTSACALSAWTNISARIGSRRICGVLIEAATARGEPLDHVLIYGPPGLGKSTLAYVLANEMGVGCKITAGRPSSGPATWRPS